MYPKGTFQQCETTYALDYSADCDQSSLEMI